MRNKLIALLLMTTISLSMIGQEADDYKPFVETIDQWTHYPDLVKEWNVIHTQPGENPNFPEYVSWLSDDYSFDRYELINERMVVKDKVYYKMNVNSKSHGQKEIGVREENRKVYVYSETDKKEYLLYDFSLKEGDTCAFYDIDSGEMVNLKVLKEGTLPEASWIYPHNTMLNYETMVEQKRPLRTWVMGIESDIIVSPPTYIIYDELFTMIEGIGCNEGPFFSYHKSNGYDYLVYVRGPERDVFTDDPHSISAYDDIMFPIFNTRYATVRGCDMKTTDKKGPELSYLPIRHDLNFELEDGVLHVYGYAYTVCGATNYAYFIEEPTADPNVHILRFKINVSSYNYFDCTAWHQTDFRVPGFGIRDLKYAPDGYNPSKLVYIVVDEYGNEYPVIKKNREVDPDDYKPFVDSIKRYDDSRSVKDWLVVHTQPGENPDFKDYSTWLSDNYSFEDYQLLDKKVEKDGKTYYRIKLKGLVNRPNRNGALVREEDRKVYVYSETDEKEYLLYDFSLEEGDTFTSYNIDSGETLELKVLKKDWLTEGPWIYPYKQIDYYKSFEEQNRPLRTWVMGIKSDADVYPPIYRELFTMIEGVGCNEGPFFSYDKVDGYDYLAFVVGPFIIVETEKDSFEWRDHIPFTVTNTRYAAIRGCKMPLNEDIGERQLEELGQGELYDNKLTFELENGYLHVSGYVNVFCCTSYYSFFIEEPTEDPLVHLLRFKKILTLDDQCDCYGWHHTDFRVPGFGTYDIMDRPSGYDLSKITYIVVDEFGKKYPVINKTQQMPAYRPFIEEDKVWKVGVDADIWTDNPIEKVEYFYFDGDTIVDGKVCKRMMERDYTKENSSDYDDSDASLSYVGAWYEKPYKVYFAAPEQKLRLMYDFSVNEGEIVRMDNGFEFTFTKIFGDINGFKGACYNLNVPVINTNVPDGLLTNVWLEGVGSANRPDINLDCDLMHLYTVLMSCTVGDEVIYLNDSYEDGVSPDANVPKRRIDFTHTVKVKPKAPVRKNTDETEEDPLVGEYSDRLLNIYLGKLNNDYSMVIKNQNDSVVYVKSVRANEIVALSIDISDYDGGDYTINIENADEVFSGVFSIDPTAIHEVASDSNEYGLRTKDVIYDLTGRPVTKDRLSKGIYIQNGKKVLVR